MKSGGKSFDIRTARDYLNHLVHESLEDLRQNPTSSRAAIAAAIFCWHLHDWVWAQYKPKSGLGLQSKHWFAKHLLSNCLEFEVTQGIADGSKHFKSEQGQPTSTMLEGGVYGLLALSGPASLTVEFHGNTVPFLDALAACVKYWDDFFKQHLP